MTETTASPSHIASWRSGSVLMAALIGVLIFIFWDSLAVMVKEDWDDAEYNHCWLIAPIALFMVATRARDLAAIPWQRSWAGVVLVAAGFVMLLLGELSAVAIVGQYAFVVSVWGVVLAAMGRRAAFVIWPALAYLVFLVPLPDFFQVRLSADLQLISSRLGVAVIRLAGLPVYLEGNVIDLGAIQLEVAEACNGLRYLFPLMSFGFLCASLFQAPWWQRLVVFLSSIPITVLMNSLRIGVIGLLVNSFGIEHAEGFMHYFEGWVVFMLCVGILFMEMWLLSRLSKRRLLKSLRMDTPPTGELIRIFDGRPVTTTLMAAFAVSLAGTIFHFGIETREEAVPEMPPLGAFPLVIGEWRGAEQPVEKIYLDALKTDAALLATFGRGDGSSVALWLAYYASQREGRSVHSPKTCMPGGGWEIKDLQQVLLPGVRADNGALPVNRAIIARDDARQLVYYWFAQRGRLLTSEYVVKWYIFWDALSRNRTDGALVRLTTFVGPGEEGLAEADQRLQEFVRAIDPKLGYFLPQEDAVMRVADAH